MPRLWLSPSGPSGHLPRKTGEAKECWASKVPSTISSQPENLSRVHDVLRVERAFQRAHGVELDPGAVVRQLVDLVDADAVLGRDRARHVAHQVVDCAGDGRRVLVQSLA